MVLNLNTMYVLISIIALVCAVAALVVAILARKDKAVKETVVEKTVEVSNDFFTKKGDFVYLDKNYKGLVVHGSITAAAGEE